MKVSYIILLSLMITILSSCNNHKTSTANKNISKEKTYAKEPKDSADFKHIKYNFYKGKDGQLYERKLVFAGDNRDTICNCDFMVIYDNKILIDLNDATIQSTLDSIIDINSFIEIDSSNYSKDKNRVYYFYHNSDGGNRVVVYNADTKTFKIVKYRKWDAEDKKNKYLNGDPN